MGGPWAGSAQELNGWAKIKEMDLGTSHVTQFEPQGPQEAPDTIFGHSWFLPVRGGHGWGGPGPDRLRS